MPHCAASEDVQLRRRHALAAASNVCSTYRQPAEQPTSLGQLHGCTTLVYPSAFHLPQVVVPSVSMLPIVNHLNSIDRLRVTIFFLLMHAVARSSPGFAQRANGTHEIRLCGAYSMDPYSSMKKTATSVAFGTGLRLLAHVGRATGGCAALSTIVLSSSTQKYCKSMISKTPCCLTRQAAIRTWGVSLTCRHPSQVSLAGCGCPPQPLALITISRTQT